jgi:hypothetical protein
MEDSQVELSVVMPCLNEADTLGVCIDKAQRAMAQHGISGEIIVADNGSTDGSRDIALARGARAVFTKVIAINDGLLPVDTRIRSLFQLVTLERGLLAGNGGLLAGVVLLLGAILQWRAAGFGALDVRHTMRWAIPGMTCAVLGVQMIFASFVLSIMGMRRRT